MGDDRCIFPLLLYFYQEARRWCRPSRHARVLEAHVLKGGVVNLVREPLTSNSRVDPESGG